MCTSRKQRSRLGRPRVAALVLAIAVLVADVAGVCEDNPPSVNTLQTSAQDSTAAELRYQNCTTVQLAATTTSNGASVINATSMGIQAVASFPAVTQLLLADNDITSINAETDATVKTIDLSSNGLASLDGLSIPKSVTNLILDNNDINELPDGLLSTDITTLSLKNNGIRSLGAFSFGDELLQLDLSGNSLGNLSNWTMPAPLQSFTCRACDVTSLSGVGFPSGGTLSSLDLSQSVVPSFEVANSSLPRLETLNDFALTVTGAACEEPQAQRVLVQSVALCVLPDSVYASKYAAIAESAGTVVPNLGNPGDQNGTQPVNGAGSNGGSNSTNWLLVILVVGMILLLLLLSSALGYVYYRHRKNEKAKSPGDDDGIVIFPTRTNQPAPTPYVIENRARSGTTRTQRTRSTAASLTMGAYTSEQRRRGSSCGSETRSSTPQHAEFYLEDDIRTDEDMLRFRLLQKDVVRGKQIAKGGYGAVYLATFRDQPVVMKQLLPERAKHKRMLSDFMDEIRVCAWLEHPKIVRFVGFTFSSLSDLSAVLEYMPRGDLNSLLEKQSRREMRDPSARDSYTWFRSANPSIRRHDSSSHHMKCKSLIALDIAEALVYLHSFESPMIHRDLKPKNVLLSEQWEAKLTDFGVSRELTEDQTMTAEIGTVSWIAPEVLRGERYSEKADVYSFGVVMTELDTCRRPYWDGIPEDASRIGERVKHQHTNTRIAVLVSAGLIKPSLHDDCPRSVRRLVGQCLALDPEERPSALQLHYELRNLELALEELATSGRRYMARRQQHPRRNSKMARAPPRRTNELGKLGRVGAARPAPRDALQQAKLP